MPDFKNKAAFDGCHVIRATPGAILVDVDGREVWIPQACVDDDSEVFRQGDKGKLVVSERIAIEKGLV